MLKELNLNHLYYFHVIATQNSIAKASKILNVSQPTLSHQLKQFEEWMDEDLFDRKGRNLNLNEHGLYLLEHTKKIFEEVENMLSGFNYQLHLGKEEFLRVGITPYISRTYAGHLLLPVFKNKNYGISVVEADLHSLLDKMKHSQLDFLLAEEPTEELKNKNLDFVPITSINNIFVCNKKLSKSIRGIKDLNNKCYFKYTSNNKLQRDVDQFFYKNDITPEVIGESDDLNIMIAAVVVNHCFALVPQISVKDLLRRRQLVKISEYDNCKARVFGIMQSDKDNSRIKSLLNAIKKEFN